MSDHARYAPSKAEHWINCPGSLHDEQENESSEAAEEGTAAHELLSHCLTLGIDPMEKHIEGATYNGFPVTYEMAEVVGGITTALKKRMANEPYEMTVEETVAVEDVDEDCWGKLDVSLYSERKKHLYIMDFKYGVGTFVQAKENWQLLLYAIGKSATLQALDYEVSRITLVISQPRCTEHKYLFDMWDIDAEDLAPYIKRAKAAIKDGKTLKAGKWCKFCPHKPYCTVFAGHVNGVLPSELHTPDNFETMAQSLTPDQIAEILDRESAVKEWFKAIKDCAFTLIKLGADVPGWTVNSGMGNRYWSNAKVAEKRLHELYGDVIYEERVLRSPAQMEKIKGSKAEVAKLTGRDPTREKLERKKDE